MSNVTVICDRCGETINGLEISGHGTAGFYRVNRPPWNRYARPDESVICDDCMKINPRYIADYMDAANENNSLYLDGGVHADPQP